MLQDVVEALVCPACRSGLDLHDRSLRCPHGHSYDVARQGYVSLLAGGARTGTADSAEMVAARAELLDAGHYAPVARALTEQAVAAAAGRPGIVVDLGAGTGHYLRAVLEALEGPAGLALDLSKYALRRAARAHPRVGAVVCDTWAPLPVGDAVASLLLNVFAPRNGPEMRRVLAPGGRALVVTPTARHLHELVGALGLLSVEQDKGRRVQQRLAPSLTVVDEVPVEYTVALPHAAARAAVAMGPSAWHLTPDALSAGVDRLPDPVEVTVSVTVTRYR